MPANNPLSSNPTKRPWLMALTEPASLLSALKWGAITGVAYYIVGLLMNAATNAILGVNDNLSQNLLAAVPLCIGIFALIFGLYTAGNRAGIERMQIAPGVLSAIFFSIISTVLSKIYSTPVQSITTTKSSTAISASNFVEQIIVFVLVVGIAIGIGYMGAFYGIKNKLKANAKKIA